MRKTYFNFSKLIFVKNKKSGNMEVYKDINRYKDIKIY